MGHWRNNQEAADASSRFFEHCYLSELYERSGYYQGVGAGVLQLSRRLLEHVALRELAFVPSLPRFVTKDEPILEELHLEQPFGKMSTQVR